MAEDNPGQKTDAEKTLDDTLNGLKKEFGKQKTLRGDYDKPEKKDSLGKRVLGYTNDAAVELVDTTGGMLVSGIAGAIGGSWVPVIGPAVGFLGGIGIYATGKLWKTYRRAKKGRERPKEED